MPRRGQAGLQAGIDEQIHNAGFSDKARRDHFADATRRPEQKRVALALLRISYKPMEAGERTIIRHDQPVELFGNRMDELLEKPLGPRCYRRIA